jgi:hypothetical protein
MPIIPHRRRREIGKDFITIVNIYGIENSFDPRSGLSFFLHFKYLMDLLVAVLPKTK